jgi:hypothetical protein
MTRKFLLLTLVAFGVAAWLAVSFSKTSANQSIGQAIRINSDDIGGTVTSSRGPKAGVWVIAETSDL